MIGLIVALQDEISYFLANNSHYKIKRFNNTNYYVFKMQSKEFVLVFSDVGLVNAAMATTALIDHFDVSFIINLGSCGTNHPDAKVLKPYVVNSAQYMNVDLTAFGYEKNQIPRKPVNFLPHKNLSYQLAQLLQTTELPCASSDMFVDHEQHALIKSIKPSLIDMELAAIAHVAHAHFIEWISIKCVSDSLITCQKTSQSHQENLHAINTFFQDKLLAIIETVDNYVEDN
ncbi:5'-methylthioadenosine/S-adenosylhomocysteine nucleosidase [Ureaplasma miroungigenitalium]|uniref:adenosylhomocysteine nucleosidase n=1 Tax=Ureaplasma miroungigenitalium TaxID=1042321 RepID=A0ABT3BM21_9BACT|nr:5'-methylthioadenosine/S-adenosylhomocysteine nucleosidase [Ureaplasma miroungigenitalium]MCV3728197.1 5'-methylthioadenosine/S-adenosylhomocysteine nucleosidase [Ureaplasma miroungigenitalium]MCV3734001.1 5'-methylthioadenosine/S-adenosylhomocysteine nucleosidase [Ureaplasma miroungigenitalium]